MKANLAWVKNQCGLNTSACTHASTEVKTPRGETGGFSRRKILKFGFHLAASVVIFERSYNSVNNNPVDWFLKVGAKIQKGAKINWPHDASCVIASPSAGPRTRVSTYTVSETQNGLVRRTFRLNFAPSHHPNKTLDLAKCRWELSNRSCRHLGYRPKRNEDMVINILPLWTKSSHSMRCRTFRHGPLANEYHTSANFVNEPYDVT